MVSIGSLIPNAVAVSAAAASAAVVDSANRFVVERERGIGDVPRRAAMCLAVVGGERGGVVRSGEREVRR